MTSHLFTKHIVVIGASAGGVEALRQLFGALPPIRAAVLVVLHIPAHTRSELCGILGKVASMPVLEGVDGQLLQEGRIYVASADRHLAVNETSVRVTRGPKECRVRPAIDVLFRTAAAAHGRRVIGVVLSGTLDDGTAGLWAVKDRGGRAVVLDPRHAEFSSMPQSAIAHVDVDLVGDVAAISNALFIMTEQPIDSLPPAGADHPHVIENEISLSGNGMRAGVMSLGKVSKYTCPDCHGVLVQIEEGRIVRFRCHTGHAFTLKTLLAELHTSIDGGLWDAIRAIEERIMLLRQAAELVKGASAGEETARLMALADDAEVKLEPLRNLVLDEDFFASPEFGIGRER